MSVLKIKTTEVFKQNVLFYNVLHSAAAFFVKEKQLFDLCWRTNKIFLITVIKR